MKKSVLLALIFLSVTIFLWVNFGSIILTGMDVLDLPSPPPPPGMAFEDEYDVVVPSVGAAVTPAPQVQVPLPTQTAVQAIALEASVSTLDSRVGTLESKVGQLETNMENVNRYVRKPVVEQPAFESEMSKVKGSAKINTILSIVLIVLLILLVSAFFVLKHLEGRKEKEENKELIGEYLRNYEKQGYSREQLREHLRASGWSDKLIAEAEKEMWA